ncbi:MAG: acyl-CoA dehydrogenase [Rhodobiaceae bacterium]|nr:acyl-CoA dehydrogenase [Rhodobiaceae bacterium]MCC0056223.1 acyl-CoA dehydrogenase [Rhodobiaceae bacterium]
MVCVVGDNEDMEQIRDAARGLLSRVCPQEKAVSIAGDPDALKGVWKQACGQGWGGLRGDDDEGGCAPVSVIVEETGRASCPLPLIDSFLFNVAAGSRPELSALSGDFADGNAIVSWALGNEGRGKAGATYVVDGTASARVVNGHAAFIEHAQIASHICLPLPASGEIAIIEASHSGVSSVVTPGLSHPDLSRLTFENVPVVAVFMPLVDLDDLMVLARFLFAARALGAVRRGLDILVAYAGEREQFGQKIGQFQAIQHKISNIFLQTETCRLAISLASRQSANAMVKSRLAATAAVLAGQYLQPACMEVLHGFGGISFWNEHEMPRHFRRVHSDMLRAGGVYAARADMANRIFGPRGGNEVPRPVPDPDLGEVPNAFRQEVRQWLAENLPAQPRDPSDKRPLNHIRANKAVSQKLGAKGWLSLSWPSEWGGQGRSAIEQLVFEEEVTCADVPVTFHNTSANMIAPALIAFGSREQKETIVPGIARGDISIALGYSEPANGSDLAGLRTRAEKVEGGWKINGQKTFTSNAGFSQYLWLAARTGTPESRHAGISMFLVPLDGPGIVRHPFIGLNDHESNTMFFDDAFVPDSALVGEVNGGWKVITAALAFERVTLGAIAARAHAYFDTLVAELADPSVGLADDDEIRGKVASLAAEVEAARLLAIQSAQTVDAGRVPLVEAAMVKVYSSELMERLCIEGLAMLGPGAGLRAHAEGALVEGQLEFGVRDALLFTIGGGTNEIQRTLIAQRGLGLPR